MRDENSNFGTVVANNSAIEYICHGHKYRLCNRDGITTIYMRGLKARVECTVTDEAVLIDGYKPQYFRDMTSIRVRA